MPPAVPSRPVRCAPRRAAYVVFAVVAVAAATTALAQELSPAMLEEAARRTGLSEEEILRRYRQQQRGEAGAAADTAAAPGRRSLAGIDDRMAGADTTARARPGRGEASYWQAPEVTLPLAEGEVTPAEAESLLTEVEEADPVFFGHEFFRLAAGVFAPPSFGPVPADYLIGVGDEIVVDAWGEVEFRVTRVVDRDGGIILPRGGKVICQNRTLDEVEDTIRQRLARSYAGLEDGSIQLEVSLGRLRAIRVFVIGDVRQPGAYELSSVATVMAALYAAGGPAQAGSLRDVQLVRDDEHVASLDVYRYLVEGKREGDRVLREGDTVLVPPRDRTVLLQGEVRRPAFYELKAGETFGDLVRFAGGFTARAARHVVHVERILPPELRVPDLPDRVYLDIDLEPQTGALLDPQASVLLDGDIVTVDAIQDRLGGWVEIEGNVKRPGRYQFNEGFTLGELIARAGGTWPDVLLELAVIDRVDEREELYAVPVDLGAVFAGEVPDVSLQERDVVHIFAAGEMRDPDMVEVRGEVREPGDFRYRQGMTLLDVIVRAGGIPPSGDASHVEIHRLQPTKVYSAAQQPPSGDTVETIVVDMGSDYLAFDQEFLLAPHDQVVVRRLPWYERQRVVEMRGEVFYNGTFALERTDERLSSVIGRAGGLKETAFAAGARVMREGLGNVAIDLEAALREPGGKDDIILQDGDRILVPERQYTVRVTGEVGFPTSLIWTDGKDIDWYVKRAGGYLEQSDEDRARVVHPNGLSQPNDGDHEVLPGSTIVVPVKPPPEGPSTLEKLSDIAAVLASLATVWLVVDRTAE